MFALVLVAAAAVVLAAIFVAENRRQPAGNRLQAARSQPVRQPQLEEALHAAFAGPTAKHGELFVSYSVWQREHETRLELHAADLFGRLNEFTRCLVVRHLWRALESLAAGSVVVVDNPPQRWSQVTDVTFHDHGIDPWRPQAVGFAPAFARD